MIIQDHHYLVEISYNQRGLFISLHSMSEPNERNTVLEIENADKVHEIMSAFDFDYEMLAKHVKVFKNQIKIRKPAEGLFAHETIIEERPKKVATSRTPYAAMSSSKEERRHSIGPST